MLKCLAYNCKQRDMCVRFRKDDSENGCYMFYPGGSIDESKGKCELFIKISGLELARKRDEEKIRESEEVLMELKKIEDSKKIGEKKKRGRPRKNG